MRRSWDDVDGEGDEESSDGGVYRAEERECDGQEPDGQHYREADERPHEDVARGRVEPCYLLPHEVERRTSKPEGYELQVKKKTCFILSISVSYPACHPSKLNQIDIYIYIHTEVAISGKLNQIDIYTLKLPYLIQSNPLPYIYNEALPSNLAT